MPMHERTETPTMSVPTVALQVVAGLMLFAAGAIYVVGGDIELVGLVAGTALGLFVMSFVAAMLHYTISKWGDDDV